MRDDDASGTTSHRMLHAVYAGERVACRHPLRLNASTCGD